MGYRFHYHGQLLAVHDAWLRSLHSAEWFGSLDLDEYLVLPPGAPDLGMYLGHVRESTGQIGVTFGMQYYDWAYGDLEAAAGAVGPLEGALAERFLCVARPYSKCGTA
jgi:hypothetical protein